LSLSEPPLAPAYSVFLLPPPMVRQTTAWQLAKLNWQYLISGGDYQTALKSLDLFNGIVIVVVFVILVMFVPRLRRA